MSATPDVARLCEISGLSDKQLVRLIVGDPNASRRLASWRSGWAEMPPQVAMRVAYLIDVIEPLADTPDDRRASLLHGGGTRSMFAELESEVRPHGRTLHAPMSSWALG